MFSVIAMSAVLAAAMPLGAVSAIATQAAPAATAMDESFDEFVRSFRTSALAEGISAETYDREMASVRPLAIVLERNDNQPEFTRPIWDYISTAASERRVTDGLSAQALHAEPLQAAAETYGVDAPLIAAIWGLESSYGAIQGNHDVLSALATLAFQGRRQSFGRSQLIGALKILDSGYAVRQQLVGSWAGAMGQTQFIPTTYLTYAVDANSDGRRDLWSDHADVFASTANYLARSGYTAGEPWGFEVSLPDNFDYANGTLSVKKTVAAWALAGVEAPSTSLADRVDFNASASILIPAGAEGPAFMVFNNYRAILKYNNSTSYAIGVGMLSNALAGKPEKLYRDWPRDDRPLTLSERKALQQALTDRGFSPGPVDGIIGAGTKRALRAWQQANDLPADGYASARVLEALQAS